MRAIVAVSWSSIGKAISIRRCLRVTGVVGSVAAACRGSTGEKKREGAAVVVTGDALVARHNTSADEEAQ